MGAIKNAPRAMDPQTYQKMQIALDHRMKGLSYATIAAIMGLSTPYVAKLVKNGLRKMIQEPAEQVRAMEVKRLDKLWEHAFGALQNTPDVPGLVNKEAMDACLKIMKRRAELLGLDMPVKIEAKVDHTHEVVQFYIPSNGRDEPPVQPAVVVEPPMLTHTGANDEDDDDVSSSEEFESSSEEFEDGVDGDD